MAELYKNLEKSDPYLGFTNIRQINENDNWLLPDSLEQTSNPIFVRCSTGEMNNYVFYASMINSNGTESPESALFIVHTICLGNQKANKT